MSNPQKSCKQEILRLSSLPPSDGIPYTLYGYRSKLGPQINRWLYNTKNKLKSVVPWISFPCHRTLYRCCAGCSFQRPKTRLRRIFNCHVWLPDSLYTYLLGDMFSIPPTAKFGKWAMAAMVLGIVKTWQLQRCSWGEMPSELSRSSLIFVWASSFTSVIWEHDSRSGDMTHNQKNQIGFMGLRPDFIPISQQKWVLLQIGYPIPSHGLRKSHFPLAMLLGGTYPPCIFWVPNSRHLTRPQTSKLSDRAYSADSLMLSPERCASRTPQWLWISVVMSPWGRLLWWFVI